jgi:hypothetical protein
MDESVGNLIREMEENYISGNTTISKYVTFDMYETLNKIDAYINSVHTSGSQDAIGRDKPFFNIVTAARNIWYRATDIDRKNIKIKADSYSNYVLAFVAEILLKNWMKKTGFGAVLNEWGRTLATYCSAVLKFVEKDGELHVSVIPWNRIICDPIDFDANPVIEVLEFTPAQLKKQGYDKEMVASLLESLTPREDLNKQKKDNKANYIKVYEVHGELPFSFLTDKEEDEDTFVQQMQVVSYASKKPGGRGNFKQEYQDFTLYRGKEKKSPYQKDDLIAEDGRTLGIGAVEHLFEAQWMANHSAKLIKDTLDFASLLVLQTSDPALVGRNVLSSLITGDILIHAQNQPLTQLNNDHDITQIQNFSKQWENLAQEITSTPDALRGNTQPAGTAYRLQQLQVNNANSLFEVMVENKGLAIEKMLREHVIPFLKTQMDTSDEIAAVLDSQGISQFDSMYVPNEAIHRSNKDVISTVLSGKEAFQPDLNDLQNKVKGELGSLGNQRFIKPDEIPDKTWKEILKGFEWEVEVDPTQESEDVVDALTSLSSTFQTIASLAGRPLTPDERLIFNTIMEKSGSVSPLQLSHTQTQVPPSGGVPTPVTNQIKQPVTQ